MADFNAGVDRNTKQHINDIVTFSVTGKGLVFDVIDKLHSSTADKL